MRKKLLAVSLAFVGSLLCGAAIGWQSHIAERGLANLKAKAETAPLSAKR